MNINWEKSDFLRDLLNEFFEPALQIADKGIASIVKENAKEPGVRLFVNKDIAFHYNGKIYSIDTVNPPKNIFLVPPLAYRLIEEFEKYSAIKNQVLQDKNKLYKDLVIAMLGLEDNKVITETAKKFPTVAKNKLFKVMVILPDPLRELIDTEIRKKYSLEQFPFGTHLIADKLLIKEIESIVNNYSLYKALV